MKLNSDAKSMHWNTILLQARNHKLWVDKAAAAPEVKSQEKGIPGKKPAVEKKERRLLELQRRRSFWWEKGCSSQEASS